MCIRDRPYEARDDHGLREIAIVLRSGARELLEERLLVLCKVQAHPLREEVRPVADDLGAGLGERVARDEERPFEALGTEPKRTEAALGKAAHEDHATGADHREVEVAKAIRLEALRRREVGLSLIHI